MMSYHMIWYGTAEEEVEISPCDVIQFSWWIVDQLVHLYGFTEEGTQEMGREMVPHWDIVHILLPITFKQVHMSLLTQMM